MNISDLFPVSTEFSRFFPERIGGCDIAVLAHQYGTPLYIYDAATFRSGYQNLRQLLDSHYPGKSQIAYAAKAYLSLHFAQKLAAAQSSIDVVSASELDIALLAGIDPSKIHLHGNNKSEIEITKAIENKIESIVVDSLDELSFIEEIACRMREKPNIWLRINPDISVSTHKAVQTGHGASKFGISIEGGLAKIAIQRGQKSHDVCLKGIHIHLGSQIFDAKCYGQAVKVLLDLCKSAGFAPEVISPGGGWGVPYTLDDPKPDPVKWINMVSSSIQDWYRQEGEILPELVIEPGRLLVARAGIALYRVGSTKKLINGTHIAALDGGMADNPRPALYGSRYTAVLLGDPSGRTEVPTRLVGRFCESGDELIHSILMPELKRGDLIAIPVSGAYQLSMSSNYNLADRPCVLWLDNGDVEVMQKREIASQSPWWLGE